MLLLWLAVISVFGARMIDSFFVYFGQGVGLLDSEDYVEMYVGGRVCLEFSDVSIIDFIILCNT